MSKIVTIQTKIRDGEILKEALRDLGLKACPSGNNGLWVQGDKFFIMEFRPTPEGEYTVSVDMEHQYQEHLNKIKQRYAYLKIIQETKKAGFTCVKEEVNQDKTLKVVMRRWQ